MVDPGALGADSVATSSASVPTHADQPHRPQTSDGVRGEIARQLPRALRGKDTYTTLQTWTVVPGVTFEQFTINNYRGPVRGQLLRIDPAAPGVRLDYAGGTYVASTAPLADLLGDDSVAAVNGDFFDIHDTGAPLGVGRDRQRGPLHGLVEGWNCALYLASDGAWHIGPVSMRTTILQHPRLEVTTVNSPSVRKGEIGLYTREWGVSRRYRIVDGRKQHVRMVIVRNGRVIANRTSFPDYLRVQGQLLVGRNAGADELARLTRGKRITTRVRMSEQPRVALTGNTRILINNKRLTIDDREMHPRTAAGVDADTGQILLLVIDGRQDFSRGYTMVELAKLIRQFGAEDAVNLDGGGSSTMMGLNPEGELAVLNSPSDGHPRAIPNGLEVLYTEPPPAP